MAGDFDRAKDEIRRRADLVDLVGQRVALKKAGRNWKGLCPFHDDRNPSFIVSSEFGHYRCWSCGAKGDVFNWVMETQRVDFIEALKILAQQTGVDLPEFQKADQSEHEQMEAAMAEAQAFFREQLREDSNAQKYLAERGLDQKVVDDWELGFGPSMGEALAYRLKKKGMSLTLGQSLFLVDQDGRGGFYDRFRSRLMFPIRDERGKLVAFGGRIVGQGNPKYINSSDTPLYSKSRVLYGMHRAKETIAKNDQAVLVEGYLDVIACHRAGVTEAVASLGTALADDHVRLLKRWCSKVVVLYDADEAGKKAADRAAQLLTAGGLTVKIALAPKGEDPDTLLRDQGPQAVRLAVEHGVSPMDFRMAMLNERLGADDDGYWTEVVQVLATAETPLELQKYLIPVAAQYPGIRDRQAAAKALERMVAAERKRAKSTGVAERVERLPLPEREDRAVPLRTNELVGAERIIFLSLFSSSLFEEAWQFAGHEPLMKSDIARKIALSVKAVGKARPGSEWLHEVTEEEVKLVLLDLGMGDSEPIERRTLEEAVDRLGKELEKREARQQAELVGNSSDDEALRAIGDRLRKIKGVIKE